MTFLLKLKKKNKCIDVDGQKEHQIKNNNNNTSENSIFGFLNYIRSINSIIEL